MINGAEDAVVGGLIGLTDGLSLVPILTRGAITESAEAIKEEVHGCGPSATKIALAAAIGAFGDFSGELAAGAVASAASQGRTMRGRLPNGLPRLLAPLSLASERMLCH